MKYKNVPNDKNLYIQVFPVDIYQNDVHSINNHEIHKRINEGNNLSGYIKDYREEAVSKALQDNHRDAYYEFATYGGYKPDFITDMFVGRRQVILEPHVYFGNDYVRKLKKFCNEYTNFSLIFIMPDKTYKSLDENLINEIKQFSTIWVIDKFLNNKEQMKHSENAISRKIRKLIDKNKSYEMYERF